MLILTRRENEILMIGDYISIKVLSVEKKKITIEISFPKNIPIYKPEKDIWRISEEQKKVFYDNKINYKKIGKNTKEISIDVEGKLCIGSTISIKVKHTGGKQTKISIDCPKEIAVHREEIYKKAKAGIPFIKKGKSLDEHGDIDGNH